MAQAAAHRHPLAGVDWCLVRATGEIDLAAGPELARVLQTVSGHGSEPGYRVGRHHRSEHHLVLDGLPPNYAVQRPAPPAATVRGSGSRPVLPPARTHRVCVQRDAAASRS
jgi:hypothetical protein